MRLGARTGVLKHPRDGEIVQALAYVRSKHAGAGPDILVGFRNDAGAIYRMAMLSGTRQQLELQRCIDRLNLDATPEGPVMAVLGQIGASAPAQAAGAR